jgi:hypothetical protein
LNLLIVTVSVQKIVHYVLEIHVQEVVSHQGRIRHEVFQLKLEELGRCLSLIEKIQGMNLLKHLVFNGVAPNCLDAVAPFTADSSQLEQFFRVKPTEKDLCLQYRCWDVCETDGPLPRLLRRIFFLI